MEANKQTKQPTKSAWKRMTLAEKRAYAPKKLNKLGEWVFYGERPFYDVQMDMRAVLR